MTDYQNLLPAQLARGILDSLTYLHIDQRSDLRPILRKRIYDCLLTLDDRDPPVMIGKLGLLSAEKVIPVWRVARPADQTPLNVIRIAIDVQTGAVSQRAGREMVDEAWEYFDNLASPGLREEELAMFAGYAALQALIEVLGNVPFSDTSLTESMLDSDLDSWSCDSAGWAVAACGGGIWDLDSDPVRHRLFWEWWLREAIPKTWRAYH